MPLASSETLAKSAGDMYLAPVGTAVPAFDGLDDTALTAGSWVHAGWLGEDGPSLSGFEGDSEKLYAWNRSVPMRSIVRVTEPMVEVPLLQWNVENLSLYFPGATHTPLEERLTIPSSTTITEKALLIVVRDGTAQEVGLWLAKTSPRGGGSIEFPGDGTSEIPITFDVLSPDTGEFFNIVGVDVAAA